MPDRCGLEEPGFLLCAGIGAGGVIICRELLACKHATFPWDAGETPGQSRPS